MQMNKSFQAVILAGLALGLAAVATAAPYAKGDKVQGLSAKDQHGQDWTFDARSTRFLLVSFDMETGKKANAALSSLGKDYLPDKQAYYLANIHGMPGVGRMFALPKMRKYPHRIILGDTPDLVTSFPQQAAKVTVLKLDHGTVHSVQYWDPASEKLQDLLH